MSFKITSTGSLDKVFCNGEISYEESSFSCLKNERFHFQVAIFSDKEYRANCNVSVKSDISEHITVRLVEHIPARFARKLEYADDYCFFKDNTAALYPDLLKPIENNGFRILPNQWQTLWITVHNENGLPEGNHEIEITVTDKIDLNLHCVYTLNVINETLPKQELIYTDWMHYDCICDKHNCSPFSTEFYEMTKKYISLAVKTGMNMLYVPLFTPPLDTAVGSERRTIQLVGVEKNGDNYAFNFSELKKFLSCAKAEGIEYFEMSHLTTQWGGKFCPKIMANVNGQLTKIFGWENSSVSEDYLNFLKSFLPKLDGFLKENGYSQNSYFHISDEPSRECYDGYAKASNAIRPILNGYKFMDAMSEADFVNDGLVDIPIVATTAYENFIKEVKKKDEVWVYYCGGQYANHASNRFFNMPSARTRVFGTQAYANDVKGFLHWGFNFYNAQYSLYEIDPYFISDADGSFISGDSYIVYPGKNTVHGSIRLEVFNDGIQDMRALKLLENKIGKDKVMELLNKEGVSGFTNYNISKNWLKDFRLKINELIREN